MKLYYSPAACSLAPHIALREAGLDFELEKVDLRAHKTADGADYYGINPKGYVPALRLEDGSLLTEVAAVLQYIADRKPDSHLAAPAGTMGRYRQIEWLNFISSEMHKVLGQLFKPNAGAELRQEVLDKLKGRFDFTAKALEHKEYLFGHVFCIADAYLFTILSWTGFLKVDLGAWPILQQYLARVAARPAVQQALVAEGLKKA